MAKKILKRRTKFENSHKLILTLTENSSNQENGPDIKTDIQTNTTEESAQKKKSYAVNYR